MDRTCVSTAVSGTSVPRRLNAPTQRGDRREATPPRTGVLVHGYSGRRASRDGSSYFFDPASDAVYVGPSRERTANGAQ